MWHPDAYLKKMLEETKPELGFAAGNEDEWREWRERLRTEFARRLGGFPETPPALEAERLESVECDGYVRERVALTTFAGLRMPAYVLIPKEHSDGKPPAAKRSGAKLPAVVAVHGHGYGSREIVGLKKDGTPMGPEDATYQKNFAVELVRRGFVVIAPELLGFGDRRLKGAYDRDEYSSCHEISTHLLQFGHTMAGHRAYDVMRSIDYLASRPDVDPARIGCMGISGGGLAATFAAALDDRIRAAVVSGYINTFEASILAVHHCVDNYVPGLSRIADIPDLAALIAPRPLLMEAGTEDPIFPIRASKDAFERIRRAYRLLGAEEKLSIDVFEGDHQISGAVAYDWLVRNV